MLKRIVELVVNTALLVWAHAVWGLALLLAWGGYAFAQDTTFPTIDPTGWGGSPFAFGAFLTLVTAAIKRAVEGWKLEKYGHITGNPWLWRGVVLVLALVGAFGLNIAKYGAELVLFGLVSPWTVLLFALASALVAMGYRDLLKSALGWIGGPVLAEPAQQPAVIGEIQPPADLKAPPPSGIEPIPGAPLGLLNVASFGGAGGLVAGFLGPQSIDMLVEVLLKAAGLQGTPLQMFRVGAKLAVVAPDLLDGDPHLSSENLARINNAILDLKKAGGLT